MSHPSEETLLDYIEGKLSDKERVRIEHHFRFCSDCVTALSLAQNLPTKEELKKIKVPKAWIERAKETRKAER